MHSSSPAKTFDYVIVGGGSAGCVLANRLSADRSVTVLLLEAGGSNRHPLIEAPAGFMKTINDPRFNFCYTTEPSAGVNQRPIPFPRGRVLGGSSAINGHLYVRGQARDYDRWAELGNQGWGYDDVLPYFKRSEDRSTGADAWHGSRGELHVSDIHEKHPLCEACLQGINELGLPLNNDYNGATQEGFGYYQRTIRNGRRWHADKAFLRPIAKRSNLDIRTNASVQRINIDGGKVTGVDYVRGGQSVTVNAAREVVLSAGAINSPQLLQVSGVGPGDLLQSLDIPVRHDLPGVGAGFQDHYAVRVSTRVDGMRTLNEQARGARLYWEVAKWALTGKGLLAFSPAHVAGFIRSHEAAAQPDLQMVFTPASYSQGAIGTLNDFPGMTAGVWQMRPQSRGYVHAKTNSMNDAPRIQPNYLEAEADQRTIVEGLKWARRLLGTEALSQWRDEETLPGKNLVSDSDLLDYAREFGATVYHAVSSCRMGKDDLAVVDDTLKVRGLAGIRIVDASVMPTMPSANTHAATLMIAEKGADLIREL